MSKEITIEIGEIYSKNKKYQTGRVQSHGYLEQRVQIDDIVYFEKQDSCSDTLIDMYYDDIKGFIGPCKTCGKEQ